ncbi:hypothetical protein C8J57DRAFT_257166 [Mycena rebaudengoi]|nr:hypothetical protein C8J57DRAFT_257166 [Mycena rebaudengoi]
MSLLRVAAHAAIPSLPWLVSNPPVHGQAYAFAPLIDRDMSTPGFDFCLKPTRISMVLASHTKTTLYLASIFSCSVNA